ncbi:hypothetical protein RclHR1_03210001 [Rhizophagus clarus]|uniref:F-box domain-containing protein n=1 Tax=Rhizophagus clarus TaxID=94130 RepID=A0A2Z6R8F2_9GLOM|nr:hypothetical protein RclHR1_03210001 [Rhizophagus clarus]GES82007.1 hypothetical protein GLOIN_2v1673105 [Rhizophagus clarus]
MIPYIPEDIVRIIIENCTTHGKKTLYKLLFVNKLWCEITIPLLWKNPWTNSNSWENLSRTILLCCDSNLKKNLFSDCDSNLKIILYEKGITDTRSNHPKNLLFNYVAYVKTLSKDIIESLIEGILVEYYELNSYNLLQRTFWNLFMNNCNKLSLNLPNYSICHFNGTKTCLPSLVKLICSTFIHHIYFLELSEICHNLQEIVINCFQDNKGLAQLIKSQKRLKRIELNSNNNNISCPLIGEALLTQSNTLTSINIGHDLCIPSEFFNSLINCEEFVISIPSESNFNFNSLVINLPNLNTLRSYIYQHQSLSLALNSLSNIILSSSFSPRKFSRLKTIDLDLYPKYLTTESINNYLRIISQYCPYLEFVVVWVRKDTLLDLELFLMKCSFLKEIKFVSTESMEDDSIIDAKIIFDILVNNNILPDLSKLTFKENWKFTEDNLCEFLENWSKNKKYPLDLLNIVTSNELVIKVCNRFKKNGVLKSCVFY